jgi:hypothetical protein
MSSVLSRMRSCSCSIYRENPPTCPSGRGQASLTAGRGVRDALQAEQQPADDAKLRAAQRARLRQLRDELVAEGADGTTHLPQLQARADTWPE